MPIKFKKSEFENIKYSLVFVNQTSGTECKDISLLNLLQISDKGINFIVPTNSCQVNHNLMVCLFKGLKPKIPKSLTFEGKNKEIIFSAIGKVRLKEIKEENQALTEVYLESSQYDKKTWEMIIWELKDKQTSIRDLFRRLK